MAGALSCLWLGDMLGRRAIIWIGTIWMIVGAIIQVNGSIIGSSKIAYRYAVDDTVWLSFLGIGIWSWSTYCRTRHWRRWEWYAYSYDSDVAKRVLATTQTRHACHDRRSFDYRRVSRSDQGLVVASQICREPDIIHRQYLYGLLDWFRLLLDRPSFTFRTRLV